MKNSLPPFDPELFVKNAGIFLQNTLETTGIEKVFVSVSGGIDSAVTLALVSGALSPKNIRIINMPYGELGTPSSMRARALAEQMGVPKENIRVVDIKPFTDPFTMLEPSTLRLGNIMARVRMTVLYDNAKKENALVIGTENRSEFHLGYFTRFGDEASDIELIRSLYKTDVYTLAKYLEIPQPVLEAPPSAELWQGQTDEDELGFSYELADPILYLLCDKGYSADQIEELGYKNKDIALIKNRVDSVRFKHRVPHVFNP